MHPLIGNLTDITDKDVESKISDLTRRYFQALKVHPGVAPQILQMLEGYKWEKQRRSLEKQKNNAESDMDKLIKIN
jgi:hypothetical protein